MMIEHEVAGRVNVRNFHAWCRDQLVHYHAPLPTTDDKDDYSRQLVERLVNAVDRQQVPRAQYEAVLIDEGHDFEPEWLRIAVQMIDPESDSLLLLYDDAQSIYGGRRNFSFKSVGVQAQGRTTILRLNYRNTTEVLRVAYEFAKEVLHPEDADEDSVPLIAPESAERHGPDPELILLPGLHAEGDYLAKRLVELKKTGGRWSDMAIVYRSAFIKNEIAGRLERFGIPMSSLTKANAKRTDGDMDSVKLVTFHSSKGLEYPVVAIPGFGFLPDAREQEQHELRLAYVAMTRATDRLIMTCHRRTPFVDRLRKAGALWHEPK
jgi:superfamily I DNA/RNA helicase